MCARAEMPQRDWRSPADVSVFRSPFTFERQVVAESAGAVGGPASGAGSGELALICACQEDDADERHFVVTVRCTAPLRADSENEWQDWLEDKEQISAETRLAESEEKSLRMGLLEVAMTELTDRERHILTERRLKDDPTTLETLAAEYGVSRERVRQIEVRAFEKLQKAMKAAAIEQNLMNA